MLERRGWQCKYTFSLLPALTLVQLRKQGNVYGNVTHRCNRGVKIDYTQTRTRCSRSTIDISIILRSAPLHMLSKECPR